jgi:hypothetical protein
MDAGRERLVADQDVLSRAALEQAFSKLEAGERKMLREGTRVLVRAAAEQDTLAFMAKMPAWKNHPRVVGAAKPGARALAGPRARVAAPPTATYPSRAGL